MKKLLTKQNFNQFIISIWDETLDFLYALLFAILGALSLAVLTEKPDLEDFLINVLSQNFVLFMMLVAFGYGLSNLVSFIMSFCKRETKNADTTVETI